MSYTPSSISNPLTTSGDLLYGGSSGLPSRLGIGSTGQFLTVVSSLPSWASASTAGAFAYFGTSNKSVYGGTNGSLSATGIDNTIVGSSAGTTLSSGTDN